MNLLITDIFRQLLWHYNFRGKGRLLSLLSPGEGEIETTLFGNNIKLDLGDKIQREMYLNIFEPWESAVVAAYLKPGMTFVDVGANVGYFTLMAASLVGKSGRVFAFEPSPYAFSRLASAIQRNLLSQVFITQAGLSNHAGTAKLQMPLSKGNHTPSMVIENEENVIEVPVLKLDDYLMKNVIQQVDLVKIDVEGFEPNVLQGASSYLRSGNIRAILCEFNSYWLRENHSTSEQLHELLTQFGFQPRGRKPDWNSECQNLFYSR